MSLGPTDIVLTYDDSERFIRETVDDAARFREARAVLKAWLGKLRIYIVQPSDRSWKVAADTPSAVGIWAIDQNFPTYAQALAFALDEAQRRIVTA